MGLTRSFSECFVINMILLETNYCDKHPLCICGIYVPLKIPVRIISFTLHFTERETARSKTQLHKRIKIRILQRPISTF